MKHYSTAWTQHCYSVLLPPPLCTYAQTVYILYSHYSLNSVNKRGNLFSVTKEERGNLFDNGGTFLVLFLMNINRTFCIVIKGSIYIKYKYRYMTFFYDSDFNSAEMSLMYLNYDHNKQRLFEINLK